MQRQTFRTVRTRILWLALACAMIGPVHLATADQSTSQVRAFQSARLDAGARHSCAVLATGAAACWGSDEFGQLGDGPAVGANQAIPGTVALPAGRRASAITAGRDHTCAILNDGSAWCWGRDDDGQLGNNIQLISSGVPTPVAQPSGRTAISVSAGGRHSCAALDDGTAWCWGTEGSGELGNGLDPFDTEATPVQVLIPAGRRATAITAGASHTCAVLDDGSAWCWGSDGSGQLGNDALLEQATEPVRVATPGGRVVAISAGGNSTCALLEDASAWCWGADFSGQLGNNPSFESQPVPVPVTLLRDVTSISVSSSDTGDHVCAVWGLGAVACWGQDDLGQLGDNDTLGGSPVPLGATLPPGRSAAVVTTGGSHSCATYDDGTVGCWGSNANGQLGNGSGALQFPTAAGSPAAIGGLTGRLADLSVRVEGAPASLKQKGSATLIVRVANAGPDTATGIRVALTPKLVTVQSLTPSAGTIEAGEWRIPSLRSGGQELLILTIVGAQGGDGSLTASIAAAGELDLDSTPGDGVEGQDDLAVASVAVTRAILPSFAVSALGASVTVSATNLQRGDRITLRCTRRCKINRTVVAKTGRVALMRGFPLPRGAIVLITITAPGAPDQQLRLRVSPQGVAVARRCRVLPTGRLVGCTGR